MTCVAVDPAESTFAAKNCRTLVEDHVEVVDLGGGELGVREDDVLGDHAVEEALHEGFSACHLTSRRVTVVAARLRRYC